MADYIVYINDRKVDYRKASISVFDYTIHCGVGLFESILAVDNHLVLADAHFDRLEKSIERLDLDFCYNRRKLHKTLLKAVAEHPGKVKKTKILLTFGSFPMWAGNKPKPQCIVIVDNHRLQFKKQKLWISPMVISSADPMRGVKSLNYMTEWMSQTQAKKAGYDQGIIINTRGQIAETGSANIFMAKNGRLYTPPLTAGGLPGITRQEIITLAQVNSIPCIEKPIKPRDLIDAEEVFTTSSFKLVWPAVTVKVDKDYHFRPGPLGKALFDRMKTNAMTGRYEDTISL